MDEGDTVDVTVTLSEDPERTVTIPITTTDQDGASSADYSGVPASVEFAPGETEQTITFTFTATQDQDNDDGESVKLSFGNTLPTGVSAGTTDEAVVTITDDDVPSVEVSFEQSSYSVDEGDTVDVTVTLSEDPERTVTVPLTKTDQDGASSADYSGVPASVEFAPGDTEQTFTFTADEDTIDDDGESVKLGFGNTLPTGVSAGTTDEAVVSITDDDVPSVEVSFEQGSYTVDEGDTVDVTVTLSEDPERSLTIPLTATDQDGASSADYSGVPASVIFAPGDTEQTITFTFTATQDQDNDDGESVKLSFGNTLPTGVSAGTTDEAVVTITDDDVPSVEVSFEQSSYSVDEGDTVDVTVTLSEDPERTVTIPLTTTDQDGASSADYSGVPASVEFAPGETEQTITFTFTATQDQDNDDGESVKLSFGNTLPTGVSAGTTDEAVVTITDDDVPSVEVSFEQGSYSVDEGDTVDVTVTLSEDPERAVTVPLTKTDQDGASSADYSGVPASVEFAPGETEQTFTFTATQDQDNDDGESVKLTFGNTLPTGVSAGNTDEAVVTITDDDVPSVEVSFEQGSYTVDEGDTVDVTVTLSEDPERAVTVPLTKTDQDGASSADYSGVPASVEFAPGETEQTFTFTAASDSVDDDGESVKLSFGNTLPTGVSAGNTDEAVVTITDDDVPSVEVSFEQSSYSVDEGDTVDVTVTLSEDPERTVTIPITTTDQDGASSSDYSGVPASITFNAGDTEVDINFTAASDTVDDDGESVKLTFGNLPVGVSAGTTDEAVVSITDDDVPSSMTVAFGSPSYFVTEGGHVEVTVTLSEDPERTVTVPLTATNQGGASDSDYSGIPSSVSFNSGETEKRFTVEAAVDNLEDDGESVKLSFGSTLPIGVSAAINDEAIVSITNVSAQNSLAINFGASAYALTEGGTTMVVVTLSTAPGSEVTIPLTATNQGGATSEDYSGVPTSLTFGSSDTTKTFDFEAAQDSVDDDGESVKLTFGNTLPAGVSAGTTDETTVSITDDDVPSSLTVAFGSPSYSVAEGGDVEVTVTLSEDPERTVTVPLTATNQDGASGADYSGVPASVTFNADDTEVDITFTAASDTVDDDGESVKLTFGNLPAGVSAGTTDETTVSITDDDVPAVAVSFEQGTYTVAEGSSVTVTVTLNADPERTVTIPITVANQDGASSADYSGVPASVTFNADDTEVDITFTASSDSVDDDGENVKLTFGNTLPTGVSAGTTDEAVVTITDDDVPSVSVSFEQGTYTVAEGSTVTVTVTLNADPERTVTIPLTATDQDGASSSDYSGVPASVTFNADDTEVDITFTASSDSVDDDGESVKLTFGNTLPTGVSAGNTDEAVVTITDDDVPAVRVSFEQGTYTVDEGSSVTVTVTLSADPERTVTMPLTTIEQDGATVDDYSGVPPSVSFTSGQTEKSLTFTAVQDEDDENAEDVTLGFGALPDGVRARTPVQATVTIIDSLRVSFGASRYEAHEGGTGAEVTVLLDSAVALETVIPITAAGMNGATDDDWTGVPEELVFASGEQSKTLTVMAYDDTVEDGGEAVELGFGTLPVGVVSTSPSTATVELMNTETEGTQAECDNHANKIIVLDKIGSIDNPDDTAFWTVYLDPYKFYLIEVIGKNDGRDMLGEVTYRGTLTLENPDIFRIWNSDRSMLMGEFNSAVDDLGGGTDSLAPYATTGVGPFQIEVGSSDGGTGMYQIKVRVNNICTIRDGKVAYTWDGGPEGYPLKFDLPTDTSTHQSLRTAPGYPRSTAGVGFLGDHGGAEPDEDWHQVDLDDGYEYTVDLWADTNHPEEHQATQLKLLGIYDRNGIVIDGTASSISGKSVSVVFEPPTTGSYYISVGSEGDDHTGVYGIRVTGRPEESNQGNQDEESSDRAERGEVEEEQAPPSAPQNLSASANEDGSVSLTWDAPDDDSVTGYQILRRRPSKGEDTLRIHVEDTGSVDATYTDIDVTLSALHVYRVKAISDAGKSKWSNKAEVTPIEPPTNTPATGAPAIGGTAQVGETLTADTAGIDDADGLANAAFSYQWLADATEIAGATGSSYSIVDADVGKTIKVRASFSDDAGNEEILTSAATAAVLAAPVEPPPAPRNLSATVNADGSITLTWDAPNDASVTGYQILRRRPTDGEDALSIYVENTGSTATTFTDTNVVAGIRYVYRVKAINEAGTGRQSNFVRADP